MTTYLKLGLLLLCATAALAQPKNKALDAKAAQSAKVKTAAAETNNAAGAKASALFSKADLGLIANGLNPKTDLGLTTQEPAPKKKDPLGYFLSQETKGGPATYGVLHNTGIVFDEWMLRMAVCMDKCETFWAAYPQTREATTQKQATAALGFGENTSKAAVEIAKASPDLFSIFLFYDQYVSYYNKMDYIPLRAYAGSIEASINWLALDPYDFRIAILQNTNWDMLAAKEASGLNRGNQRNTTKFIPLKK